ncbi:class I SAM-dependent methyltransferase [Agrobacterium sp. a22-2]|uniref:class I SAM-dependent methyltransferase n=1 Tax=Agrobacterium sp. a22-2 TaxID=2283840 RepID=UPI001446087B|nr:class I SAM-dependent methyltransferase [Agrobacterium sp. a22-2]NKN35109.1 class I SAM-dependent methyltransferase [Agrobacterium sp. a22-2]
MQNADDPSVAFYAANAVEYAARDRKSPTARLEAFLDKLVPGARILELGCGAGEDSAMMLARGFDVTPTDGTVEMAAEAERQLQRPVQVLRFDEIDALELYDGIWANACLLHVPKDDLQAVLARIQRATTPGGMFYASYKTGGPQGTDRYGRYYNRPSATWLSDTYRAAGWIDAEIDHTTGGGYDGEPTDWLYVTARKP